MARPPKNDPKEMLEFMKQFDADNGRPPNSRELHNRFGGSMTTINQIMNIYEKNNAAKTEVKLSFKDPMLANRILGCLTPVISDLFSVEIQKYVDAKELEIERKETMLQQAFKDHQADVELIDELREQIRLKDELIAENAEKMVRSMTENMNKEAAMREELRKNMVDMKVNYEVRIAEMQRILAECQKQNSNYQEQIKGFQKILADEQAIKESMINLVDKGGAKKKSS